MSTKIYAVDGVDRRELAPISAFAQAAVDDGKHISPETPSAKGKIDAHKKLSIVRSAWLRFPRALAEVAKVSEFGCSKYEVPLGDLDYLKSPSIIDDCTDALGRHLLREKTNGPINYEDGEVLEAAQIAWNALARLEAMLDRGIVQPAQHKLMKRTIKTELPSTIDMRGKYP